MELRQADEAGNARAHRRLSAAKRPRRAVAAGRSADRRRVRSAVLPRHSSRRAVDRPGAVLGGLRRTIAAVRERRHAARAHAGAGARPCSATRTISACWRCRISGTSRCRRTWARRRRAEHAALYRQAVALIAELQRRGAELASPEYPAVRHRVRRREADVGAGLLHEALPRGVSGRHARTGRSATHCGRSSRASFESSRRTARALPSRLSQPQSDAARVAAVHHRLPGRAAGTRHLRSGLAAARLVRRSARADGRRADRVFPGVEGRSPARSASSGNRFDVMALQRNLKALGTFGYQTTARRNPVYIQYIPRTLRYVRNNLAHQPPFRPHARAARDARRRVSVSDPARRGRSRIQAGSRVATIDWFFQPPTGRPQWPCASEYPPICTTISRLSRDHLATIASYGFEAVEVFATRSHFDYHDADVDRASGELAERDRARAARHPRADHGPPVAGRPVGRRHLECGQRQRAARRRRCARPTRRWTSRGGFRPTSSSSTWARRPRRAARTTGRRRFAASKKSARSPSRSASGSRSN